jgi:hypothetical protein
MSLSRFLSATSLVVLASVAPGCGGDDSCGSDGAPAVGLVASGTDLSLTYGGLTAGLNRDCPAADAPAGVISLTILGTQTDGTGFITLCVSRPDVLTDRSQTLALDDPAAAIEVRLVDLNGGANNCRFAIDRTQPVTGTVSSSGMCGDGSDPAGFALVVDGALTLRRTCGTTVDSVPITLRGRVAVQPQ